MKKLAVFIVSLICVLLIISSCKSTSHKEYNPNNPEDVALKFTRLFFSQIAYSRNNDFSNDWSNSKKNIPTDTLSPFEKVNVSKPVAIKLSDFYKSMIPPALHYDNKFYENLNYKIKYTLINQSSIEYRIAAIKLPNKVAGSEHEAFLGLIVNVDTNGNQPMVSDFKYTLLDIPRASSDKKINMFGFGMPELIIIAVILGIVILIVVFKKKGGQKSNYIPSDNISEEISFTCNRLEGKLKPSLPVLIFACGLLGAFFMPWFQLLGFNISGYQIGKLGSYGNYAWIIPILAGSTIIMSLSKTNNRQIGAFSGLVPLGALFMVTMQVSKEFGPKGVDAAFEVVKQLFSIGAYITIISSIGMIYSAFFIRSERYSLNTTEGILQKSNSVKRGSMGDSLEIECPVCAETIKAKAQKCRFCGHMLNSTGL